MASPQFLYIRNALISKGTSDNKIQSERYFKNVIKCHGVKAPEIRIIFGEMWNKIGKWDEIQIRQLALELLRSPISEEKYMSILFLNRISKKVSVDFIHELESIIPNHVYDWATADGIAGKVIRFLIPRDPRVVATLLKWKDSNHLWTQRIAAVSFVLHARHGKFNNEILTICSSTIKNPERFVQLGTGWVLRELSLADQKRTIEFIKKNYQHFSREGLRYCD